MAANVSNDLISKGLGTVLIRGGQAKTFCSWHGLARLLLVLAFALFGSQLVWLFLAFAFFARTLLAFFGFCLFWLEPFWLFLAFAFFCLEISKKFLLGLARLGLARFGAPKRAKSWNEI